jgi:hypothetical protein
MVGRTAVEHAPIDGEEFCFPLAHLHPWHVKKYLAQGP